LISQPHNGGKSFYDADKERGKNSGPKRKRKERKKGPTKLKAAKRAVTFLRKKEDQEKGG